MRLRWNVSLLMADICMPGNDALELAREPPEIAPGLPTILLTGPPTVETAAQSVRLIVMAYLTNRWRMVGASISVWNKRG